MLLLIVAIGVVLGYKMWRTFPSISDSLHIEDEIIYVVKRQGIIVVLYLAASICELTLSIPLTPSNYVYLTGILIFQYGLVVYPYRINNAKYPHKLSVSTSSKWTDIIADQLGLEALMDFMQSEFATENILFAIENIMLVKLLSSMPYFSLLFADIVCKSILPEEFPFESEIVSTFDPDDDALQSMDSLNKVTKLLFDKYICKDCLLEINISCQLKRQISVLFEATETPIVGEGDAVLVMKLYTTAFEEVGRMMDGSFIRFNSSAIGHAYYERHLARNSPLEHLRRQMSSLASINLSVGHK